MRFHRRVKSSFSEGVICLFISILSWIHPNEAIQELFPVHPEADKILREFNELSRVYGREWDQVLSELMTACHPANANTVAHMALALVNIRRRLLSLERISCPVRYDLSSCVALDSLDNDGMKHLVEYFVKLNAICTAVAHSQRKKATEKIIQLASKLNKAVVDEMSVLDSTIQQRMKWLQGENVERILQDEFVSMKKSEGSSTKSEATVTSLGDIMAIVSSLADDASQAVRKLISKGSYYLYVSYILVTYVSLLLVSHWLTCGMLRSARQSCFLIAFSNCLVHSWILHRNYSSTSNASIDSSWLTPSLTESTQMHLLILAAVLIVSATRGSDPRTKCVNHIAKQHAEIRNILLNQQRSRRLAEGLPVM